MVRRFPGGILVGQDATDPLGLVPLQQLQALLAGAGGSPFTPTAVITAASYTAASGQLVLVAPTVTQTVTLPAATPGAYVAVRRTNAANTAANTQVRAATGGSDTIAGVSAAPVWIRAQDEAALLRCYSAGVWVLEWHGTPSGGLVLPTRQILAGTGLSGGGDLSGSRTLRMHQDLLTELWTDWANKADGPIPATGDEGRPIVQATGAVGTPAMVIEGGGVVQPGTGAGYLLQTTTSSKKIRFISATFQFTSTSDGQEVLALCAFINTAISPQQASLHVVVTKTSWSIQCYDGSVVQIKTGNYVTALSNNVEYRVEVTLIGDTLFCTFPDGTYAVGAEARVASLNGIAACWEIVQTNATKGIKLLRSRADDQPDRVLGPSEPRVGQIARRAFPTLFYDDATGNIGIGGAPAAWAPLWIPGVPAAFNWYAASPPSDPAHTTRKDYVDRQVIATVTAAKTAAYTAAPGEFVMVDASAGPVTITLPPRSTGGPVSVKKTDATANLVTVATAAGDTLGVQAATSMTLQLQHQIKEYRPGSVSTNWAVTGGDVAISALDARYRAPARAVAAGASVSIDITGLAKASLTCTADSAITFTGTPYDGQTVVLTCLASGAQRIPSVFAGAELAAGVTARSLTIASGKKGRFVLQYSTLGTPAWSLDSAYLVG